MASASLIPVKGKPGQFFNKLTGGVIDIVEWREDDKYDTVDFAAALQTAGATSNFFRDLTNKNLIDSNFTTPRRLPAGEEMIIDRCWAYIPAAVGNVTPTPSDIKKMGDNAYIKFQINRKDVAEGPLVKFPSGYGFAGNSVENNQGVVSVGVPSTAAAAKLVREQYITHDHDVDCTLQFLARTWDGDVVQPTFSAIMHVKAGFHGLVRAAATK